MNDIQPPIPKEEEIFLHEEVVVETRDHLPNGRGVFLQMILAGVIGGGLMFGLINHFGITQSKESIEKPAEDQMAILPGIEDESLIRLVEERGTAVVSIVISKEIKQAPSLGGLPFFFPFNKTPPQEATGETKKQQVGSGSGFIVSADGLIVTNKHVVSDEEATYTVVQSGGAEFAAKVLARDPNNDVAILKIEGTGFPVLPLGDSDSIKVGQTAIAIGNPLGEFANSVSRGIISGMKRDVTAGSGFGQEERLTNIIQTDAAINPGNSGGPLFDINGRVIGINVAVAQGAENIGFALPINDVKRSITQVRENGRIITPYIGVRYALLNEKAAKSLNLPYSYGALVLRGQNITDFAVIPDSPADKAGIMENDILLEINGKKIDEANPLGKMLSQMEVNQEITVLVWHTGETKEIKLTIEEKK